MEIKMTHSHGVPQETLINDESKFVPKQKNFSNFVFDYFLKVDSEYTSYEFHFEDNFKVMVITILDSCGGTYTFKTAA